MQITCTHISILEMIQKCTICCENFQISYEPMIPSTLPQWPWEKIGTDLFELKNKSYLLLVDYFSRYIEVVKLVVAAMKPLFARHGNPDMIVSDNGPQYSSQEFQEFAKDYNIEHVTSTLKGTGRLSEQSKQSRNHLEILMILT